MHIGDDDTTWSDDMIVEVVHAFVSDAVGAAAREEIDLPHIVVCRDPESGAVSYSGPFPDGLAALVSAERESRLDRVLNGGSMDFSVAALFPVEIPDAG